MAVSRNSRVYCGVFGCKTFYSTNENISFHVFPKDNEPKVLWTNKMGIKELADRRRVWAMNLRMGKDALQKTQLRVCSLHFTENDFMPSGVNVKRKRLKPTAIPSVNLPKSTVPLQCHKKRRSPKKRCLTDTFAIDNSDETSIEMSNNTHQSTCLEENYDIDEDDNSTKTICELYEQILPQNTNSDVSTQVTSGDLIVPFISLINSNKTLNTMTGIPSIELLNKIVELYSSEFPDKRTHNLSYKERIIMIFMKFKHDLSFLVLSILFKHISPESCRLIYTSVIQSLAMILNSVIYWPSKQEILSNMPYCFEKFSNTRLVIDCTEISVQKPKCLTCRIKTYSNYKSTFTLKFLIGVSPGGLITYVSKPYGGRASDKKIFEQSGLIEMLDRFDGLMVDKGFLIDDLCLGKQIELIRPPFLKNKKIFSKAEALLNKDIASARVHIERINQRIKMYKIFQNKFAWSQSYLAYDIMIIIAGMCNLSSPIFANDKFSV